MQGEKKGSRQANLRPERSYSVSGNNLRTPPSPLMISPGTGKAGKINIWRVSGRSHSVSWPPQLWWPRPSGSCSPPKAHCKAGKLFERCSTPHCLLLLPSAFCQVKIFHRCSRYWYCKIYNSALGVEPCGKVMVQSPPMDPPGLLTIAQAALFPIAE